MKLLSFDTPCGESAGALLPSGEVLALAAAAKTDSLEVWLPRRLIDILQAGEDGLRIVRSLVDRVWADERALQALRDRGALMPLAATRLLAPISSPSLLLAVGLAYKSHLAEMRNTPAPPHPSAFIKLPASIQRPNGPIPVPPDAPAHIDFEGELAVVFGRRCHKVRANEALDYVAGYTVCNDVSARDWVEDVFKAKTPWEARWTWEVNVMGKSFPGFTPLGPVLTTADEIDDPHSLTLKTRLNGQIVQHAETSDMIFSLNEVIAYFSRWYTFQPGDVLATGTPAGVGVGRKPPLFMKPGDVIEVEISKIGILRNIVEQDTLPRVNRYDELE
jgi:2-keto-4-pentenoate hydratase/2-oxohepta-3-ene-1,7-dioic acid hydratase in catechol pathway